MALFLFYDVETGQIVHVDMDPADVSPFHTYSLALADAEGNLYGTEESNTLVPYHHDEAANTQTTERPARETTTSTEAHHYTPYTPLHTLRSTETNSEAATHVAPTSTETPQHFEEEEFFTINQFGYSVGAGFGAVPKPKTTIGLALGGGGFGHGHGGPGGPGGKKGGGGYGGGPGVVVVGKPYAVPIPYPINNGLGKKGAGIGAAAFGGYGGNGFGMNGF